ncbi:cystin-1 isoform X1 [Anas platyrhynchos]|uniref:cystin-1 isoform X1 n=1 Tax=Anas platyrhynchos TaxID=8839 RepID=UPI0018D95E2C|nr:cystin-1 isoform X1 [Anas platyrhynchos]
MGSGSSRRRGPVATGGGGGGDPRGPGATPSPAEAAAGGEGAAALPTPGSPPREAVLPGSPPDTENNNVSNDRCPGGSSKQPAGCPAVSYDCAEEELMASIEREYGR